MLLALQFPLADSRSFVTDGGRMSVPHWHEPQPDKEFLRYFGAIRLRRSGGLAGWVGENEICEADQALRFPQGLGYIAADVSNAIRLRCIYRRFFSDGHAVGKYEVGVGTMAAPFGRSAEAESPKPEPLSGEQVGALIDRFLHTPVTIRDPRTEQTRQVELGLAGKSLAALYLAASSEHPFTDAPDWWVTPGSPLLFLDTRGYEDLKLRAPLQPVKLHRKYRLQLSWGLWPYAGGRIRMWVLQRAPQSGYRDEYRYARTLRLYLMRLHAEHECLNALLRNIRDGHLSVKRGDDESEALQAQLSRSMERIESYASRAAVDFNPAIEAIARQSVDAMSPGQRDRLVERLKELDLRGNIVRGVKQYADAIIAAPEEQRAAQMAPRTKAALIEVLLDCPSIEDGGARDVIVKALPKEIKNHVERNSAAKWDVIALVDAALNYLNGLPLLVESVRYLEGDSLPMREVDRVIAEWRKEQATG